MTSTNNPPIWTPSAEHVAATRLHAFAAAQGLPDDYATIHAWSIQEPDAFWAAVWDFGDVRGERGERIIVPADVMLDTQFFPDASLNFAENLLRRNDDGAAILFRREDGVESSTSWAELHDQVSRAQQAMRAAGVQAGDRVGAWMPNVPETYVVMLAAASLGAVFSSSSPDFGADSVVDRFGQIEPTLLFAADGYVYNGKSHDCLERLADIRRRIPSLRQVVVLEHIDEHPAVEGVDDAVSWSHWLHQHEPVAVTYEPLPFNHPLVIVYSSGTTGLPKCIVHGAGGALLKHLIEHQLQGDIKRDDRVLYFTTTGWIMWNWLATALASEATVVLYDGNPTFPGLETLWELADDFDITFFGTSARFLDTCKKFELQPRTTSDLSAVRTIMSTGSPLAADSYEYVYRDICEDVHLGSISGGTDLCGSLVGPNTIGPVWPGEIQAPVLGMAIDIFDEQGESAADDVPGELVCTNTFPTMPLSFWNDPDGTRLRAAYFDRFPGAWHQGDFATRTSNGGFLIHGRSDATLNPGGVRIGTSEIYRQLDGVYEIIESVVVGQRSGDDVKVAMFVVMREGYELTDELIQDIRSRIRAGTTPRHMPSLVAAVPDIPKTRNGKITELAVRDALNGKDAGNTDALANPEALEYIREFAQGRP